MSDDRDDDNGRPVSPPAVVQTAYHTAKAAEYARMAADSLAQATECAKIARDEKPMDGLKLGNRHMDWGSTIADLYKAQAAMYRIIPKVQKRQCEFNRKVLRNKPVTQDQLNEYGSGCR